MDKPDSKPYRIWATAMPFRRDGMPVVGNLGSSVRTVVIMDQDTFTRLCKEIPAVGTAQFELQSYGDE